MKEKLEKEIKLLEDIILFAKEKAKEAIDKDGGIKLVVDSNIFNYSIQEDLIKYFKDMGITVGSDEIVIGNGCGIEKIDLNKRTTIYNYLDIIKSANEELANKSIELINLINEK